MNSFFNFQTPENQNENIQINSPKELISLAKKYAPSILGLRFLLAIVVFKNGTCVEIYSDDLEEKESIEDCAIRLLKAFRDNFYPEEYGPDCVDEETRNEYGNRPFCSNSKGYINLFFWSTEDFHKDCAFLHTIVDADLSSPEVVHVILNEKYSKS